MARAPVRVSPVAHTSINFRLWNTVLIGCLLRDSLNALFAQACAQEIQTYRFQIVCDRLRHVELTGQSHIYH
jgi:hypothetical protein